MLRFFLLIVLICLNACVDPLFGSHGPMPSPFISQVIDDSGGQKYFAYYGYAKPSFNLYAWDTLTTQWVKRISLNDPRITQVGHVIYLDLLNNPAQNIFLYDPYNKKRTTVNLNTSAITSKQFSNNYSIISADKFAVYTGNLVELYQVSSNTFTNLHSLPSITTISNDLGLKLNATQYTMLCTPHISYNKWDYQTHVCTIAKDVRYSNDLTPTVFSNAINDNYRIVINIQANGIHTSQLWFQDKQYRGTMYFGEWFFDDLAVDYPMFAVYRDGCVSSIDVQKNMHEFCITDLAQPNVFTYSFYDKAAPTTPLYTQILP